METQKIPNNQSTAEKVNKLAKHLASIMGTQDIVS